MKSSVMTISPEMAQEFLKGNLGNRTLRKTIVEFYADEMKKGNWKVTHQGIAISKSGRLIDGQHRLSAIVKSGISVDMTIFEGCDDDSFAMLDLGLTRNTSDTVGVAPKVRGIILALIKFADRGAGVKTRISHLEIKRIYDKNQSKFNFLAQKAGAVGMTASTLAGAFLYLIDGGDADKLHAMKRFVVHGTTDGINQALIYSTMKILRNEDRFSSKIEAGLITFKALNSADSVKIVRIGIDDFEEFVAKCKMVVS